MLTHNNQECHEMILEYSELIQNYLNGNYYIKGKRFILDPSGYIRNTFNNSVFWAGKPSFEEAIIGAIIGAVNDGGDADTIAAIAGSLVSARCGIEYIPEKGIEQLDSDVKDFLKKSL